MFPLTIKGRIRAQHMGPEAARHTCMRLKQQLELADAMDIELQESRLSFRVKLYRYVSRFNILRKIDGGSIEVIQGEPGQLRYLFSCRRQLLISCVISSLFGLVIWLANYSPQLALRAGLIAWCWLFAVDYLFSCVRLRRFVKAAIYRK